MSAVSSEGNTTLHNQSPEAMESEKKRERWTFGREPRSPERERQVSMEVVSSGSMIEATGGFAAVILAILGFATVAPAYLIPIAAIALGVALLFEGGAVAARYWRLPEEIAAGRWASTELAVGMFAEFAAGVAGVVLGILSLLALAPVTLLSTAILVFGIALVLGSGLTYRLNSLEYAVGPGGTREREEFNWFARFVDRAAVGIQVLIGLVTTILGILALVGIASAALVTTSVLIIGFSALLSGSAVSSRIMHLMHRC